MPLVGQVDITYLVSGTIETVDALKIGKFEGRDTAGPVATVTDDEHRFGSHDGCQLSFAGAACCELYGFAALAGTTTVEVRGQVNHRGTGCDARVEQGQQDGMCTTARATHHAHTCRVDVFAVFQHIVEQDVTAGGLIDVGTAGVVSLGSHFLLALAPTVQVEIYADGTHTCQRAQALLLVLAIAVGPMAVRTDDEG